MSPKILVVEDDPVLQRLYQKTLEASGFQFALAINGMDIVNRVMQEAPTLVLMDVMMPERNGLDALKDLKADERTSRIPVILLSAHEDDNLLIQGMQAGASRYLIKSRLEPKEVIDLVNETLGRPPSTSEDSAK